MRKVLLAVNDVRESRDILAAFHNSVSRPDEVVLLHVERIEGDSLMIDMLGDAELSTLKEAIKGTEHKEALDKRAERTLSFYRKALEENGITPIKALVREGLPAEEILKAADEEGVGLIVMGRRGWDGLGRLITGSVSREVQDKAKVPVLVAKHVLVCEEPYSWKDAYAAVSVFTAVFIGLLILALIIDRSAFPF